MGTTKATREQFVMLDDREVRHEPSGAKFWAYRYADPNDTKITSVNRGQCGEVLGNGEAYDLDDVKAVALALLRESATKRVRGSSA